MGAPKDSKKPLLIVALAVLGAAVFGLVGWGLFVGWTVANEPDDARRGIEGAHLAALYEDPELANGTVEIVRTRYIDGTTEVTVDYAYGEAVATSSMYSIERRDSDALGLYGTLLLTGPLMEAAADVELEERPELFSWGDNSTSKVIMVGGEPLGHFVVARKGKVVITVTVAGLYEPNAEGVRRLLAPMLESAEREG